MDTSIFGNAISGSGGLTKAGSGTLVLAERSSYSGDTILAQGGMIVRQGLANSSVTAYAGTRFQGVGSFLVAGSAADLAGARMQPVAQLLSHGLHALMGLFAKPYPVCCSAHRRRWQWIPRLPVRHPDGQLAHGWR